MKKLGNVIRYILTLFLVFMVYTETGIWTALSLFLIFVGMEIYNNQSDRGLSLMEGIIEVMKMIVERKADK